MAIIYHVNTKAYLHNSKKFFDCKCEALKYIKKIVEMCPNSLSDEELDMSVLVTRIDDEIMPDYKRIFPEQDAIRPTFRNDEYAEELNI